MTRSATWGVMVAACLAAVGCSESQQSNPEVPTAGAAARKEVDPGPAPDGQSEPDDAQASEPATTEAPAVEEAAGGPATSAVPDSGVRQVAFRGEVPAQGAEVAVKIQDWKKTEELIASHKGKVVVVDMWSLSCDPCRREFPHLVKLHNDRKSTVACISVSTDYAGIKSKPPEFYQKKVLEFLTQQKATFDNVLCSVDSETLFDDLGLSSIPAVYVYDKDGQLAQKFAGEEVHYDKEVIPLVEKLLAK